LTSLAVEVYMSIKVGDLVTGVDRTYSRSIYECVEIIDAVEGVYKPVAYKGKLISAEEAKSYTHIRNHNEFRFATKFEYTKASTRSFNRLIGLIFMLGIDAAGKLHYS
jgi:hypothetical protein